MEYAGIFMTGAVLYSLIEILWRGRTHWTMAVTGGLCLLLIHICNERHANLDMLSRCSLSSFYITGVEFARSIFNIFRCKSLYRTGKRW